MTALVRLEDAGAVEIRTTARWLLGVEPDEVERAMGEPRSARVRPLAARDDARLRRARALPTGVHPVLFRRAYDRACGTATTAGGTGIPPAASEPSRRLSVDHEQWGEGVVQRYDSDQIVLLFNSVGYRTLSVALVAERDLLSRA